jgi:glycosyltransferase involved in cell wall biosynthesis
MQKVTVIHIVPDLRQQAGGLAATVPGLAEALSALDVDSRFVTYAHDDDFAWAEQTTCVPHFNLLKPGELGRVLEDVLASLPAGAPVLLHSHGLWDMLNHAGIRVSTQLQLPTVLSLHGMLLPWARRHKKLRKDIAWGLYQRRDLVQASAVHVTSSAEANTAAEIVPINRVHTIPFGVSFPRSLVPTFPDTTTRTLLFLGRLHPIKNLEALIRAFVRAAPAQYRLQLVGPDEDNHKATLLALIQKLEVGNRIVITGPAYGVAKEAAIAQADVVILPSFTENFGAVVAEALAMGRPVISSTGAPWDVLRTERCGWWVDPSADSLAQAIDAFCATSRDELEAMGERGRAYVSRSLTHESAAARMVDLYSSVFSRPNSSGSLS